ncbi:hypothetical protein PoB_007156700 [Plakobranchus ocellatus]|uniref:Uncharacterized protein n=1 Tax=Plakobranchus ocellatus TaxID=259542 RepID=A0AAV4DLB0_9GAST|nr:hypothetical protein PoB_007156700 [Plakobranchus ocellatus]
MRRTGPGQVREAGGEKFVTSPDHLHAQKNVATISHANQKRRPLRHQSFKLAVTSRVDSSVGLHPGQRILSAALSPTNTNDLRQQEKRREEQQENTLQSFSLPNPYFWFS